MKKERKLEKKLKAISLVLLAFLVCLSAGIGLRAKAAATGDLPEWAAGRSWGDDIANAISDAVDELEDVFGTATASGAIKTWDDNNPNNNNSYAWMQEFTFADDGGLLSKYSEIFGWAGDNRNMAVVYNPRIDKAFGVYNNFMKAWGWGVDPNWSVKRDLGAPKSAQYEIEEALYQNFEGGYIKDESGTVSLVLNRNVDTDNTDTFSDFELTAADKIGGFYYLYTFDWNLPNVINPMGDMGFTFHNVSSALYDAAKKLENDGFDLGDYSANGGNTWDGLTWANMLSVQAWNLNGGSGGANNSLAGTILCVVLNGSDSNTSIWSDERDAVIVYNPNLDDAFAVYDEFVRTFIFNSTVSLPVSDMKADGEGTKYQNFGNGYLKKTADGSVEFVNGKNIDFDGFTEFNAFDAGNVGTLDSSVTGFGEDADEVKSVILAAFDGVYKDGGNAIELGLPVGLVYRASSNSDNTVYYNIFYQEFENGRIKGTLVYDGEDYTMTDAGIDTSIGSQMDRTKIGAFESGWGIRHWMGDISAAILAEYERLEGLGINPGTVAGNAGFWDFAFKQDFSGPEFSFDPWGDNRKLMIMYNPLTDAAYGVYNGFYEVWKDEMRTLGVPCSHQVEIGGVTYQNFAGGYIKVTDAGAAEAVFGKRIANIDESSPISPSIANLMTGQIAGTFFRFHTDTPFELINAIPAGTTWHEIAVAFNNAAIGAESEGFNLGVLYAADKADVWANGEGVKLWDTKTKAGSYILMDFYGTKYGSDVNTYIWSEQDGRTAVVIYNANQKEAHFVYGDFAKAMFNNESTQYKLRVPTSGVFKDSETNTLYMNFNNGYMKKTGEDPVTVTQGAVNIKSDDFTEINPLTAGDIGMFDLMDTAGLDDATIDAVSQAIIATAGASSLTQPTGFITKHGSGAFYQAFSDGAVYVVVKDNEGTPEAAAIYFAPSVFGVFDSVAGFFFPDDELGKSAKTLLGGFVNAVQKDGASYYNFEYGYISLTADNKSEMKIAFRMTEDGEEFITVSDPAFFVTEFDRPSNLTLTDDELLAKFKAKYDSLIAAGFNPGLPDSEGVVIWTAAGSSMNGGALEPGKGWIKQGFIGGSSKGFSFGINMYLVYNIEMNEVFAIYGHVMNQAKYILYEKGAPECDPIVEGDRMKQQFQKGYISTFEQWGSFFFFDGVNMFEDVEGEPVDPPAEEEPGLTAGQITGIVLGSIGGVLLLGGGGFCLYWFVIRKKKMNVTKAE